ncbi:MAG: copper chaperone PCu(A)C [Alphaproteobacteria bacterium]
MMRFSFNLSKILVFLFGIGFFSAESSFSCDCENSQDETPQETSQAESVASVVTVVSPWVRPSLKGRNAGVFMKLLAPVQNQKDNLVGGSTPVAKNVELHAHVKDDKGIFRMRPVKEIQVEKERDLKPGDYHVMLMSLSRDLKKGDMVDLTLQFEKSGKLQVKVPVQERAPR